MSLHGTALIAIWHDLKPDNVDQFQRWHTEEHMPERLGVPGFLRGRRYMNWEQSPHVCFTIYEIAHMEVFRSPGYLARLNAPTEWSTRVQPGMTNFLRGPCENVLSLGSGTGGAIATARIRIADAQSALTRRKLSAAALSLSGVPGITSVHLTRHELALSGLATSETALRPPSEPVAFDYLLMLEAIDVKTLQNETLRVNQVLQDAGAMEVDIGCYVLGFELYAPH
ncbi:MAG: hypothetical protein WAW46_11965 [Polaromonas sp.]